MVDVFVRHGHGRGDAGEPHDQSARAGEGPDERGADRRCTTDAMPTRLGTQKHWSLREVRSVWGVGQGVERPGRGTARRTQGAEKELVVEVKSLVRNFSFLAECSLFGEFRRVGTSWNHLEKGLGREARSPEGPRNDQWKRDVPDSSTVDRNVSPCFGTLRSWR